MCKNYIILHCTSTHNDYSINSCQFCCGLDAVRGAENKRLCVSTLPDYVIVVPQVKFLLMLPGVVHNSHTSDKIDYFLGGGVVQVVAALMSPVSIHPLQSQVAVGSSSVSHVRTSVCVSVSLSRRVSDIVSFTNNDLF